MDSTCACMETCTFNYDCCVHVHEVILINIYLLM